MKITSLVQAERRMISTLLQFQILFTHIEAHYSLRNEPYTHYRKIKRKNLICEKFDFMNAREYEYNLVPTVQFLRQNYLFFLVVKSRTLIETANDFGNYNGHKLKCGTNQY